MERTIHIHEDFCAVSEDGRLTEYIPGRGDGGAGQILFGRVDRMMPSLEAAFVDVGRARDGFLPLKEASRTFTDGPVRSGDRVMVQIRREENGGKGVLLSRDLSIPGAYVILMPKNRHIGISARIKDEKERERLTEMGRRLSGGEFGLVMREAAGMAAEEEVRAELEDLIETWRRIQRGDIPSCTAEEELIRDYGPRGISRIARNEPLNADLTRQLREAESRTVRMPRGGNLVIDRCEAMTVIDVNSASDASGSGRRETALRTNLDACREIMIQTRLRNLGGILILDLIDMEEEEDRRTVRDALEECFRADRMKTVIHGYTSLGLMEMTRKRSRSPWAAAGAE